MKEVVNWSVESEVGSERRRTCNFRAIKAAAMGAWKIDKKAFLPTPAMPSEEVTTGVHGKHLHGEVSQKGDDRVARWWQPVKTRTEDIMYSCNRRQKFSCRERPRLSCVVEKGLWLSTEGNLGLRKKLLRSGMGLSLGDRHRRTT